MRRKITGHILTQASHPCGRLVMIASYDSAEQIMEFLVPSLSRADRVYGVEVCAITGQVACACEAFRDFREAHLMPYRRDAAGTAVEHLARAKGKTLLPLITRSPGSVCPHVRKVRAWLLRHGLMPVMRQREAWLMAKVEALPEPVKDRALRQTRDEVTQLVSVR